MMMYKVITHRRKRGRGTASKYRRLDKGMQNLQRKCDLKQQISNRIYQRENPSMTFLN